MRSIWPAWRGVAPQLRAHLHRMPARLVLIPRVYLSDFPHEVLTPRLCVIGVGGAGGNTVNNMIKQNFSGLVPFFALCVY